MSDVQIEGSFELLTQDEWDNYLGVNFFDNMNIGIERFGVSMNGFPDISHPRLAELIQDHNNKVGSLVITYALCRHYFDKGIPDDPWYISPGKEGQSIQYFPNFKEEHWMRRYWFNYFSDTFYMKLSSVWDSIIEILNHYYSLDYPIKLGTRKKVIDWLDKNVKHIASIFKEIEQNQLYINAKDYRNRASHGTSAASVTNTIKSQKDVWTEVHDRDSNGNLRLDENNKPIMKKVKAKSVISMSVGNYTNVPTIMENMEKYSVYSGLKIQEIISLVSVKGK
ncbi:hypothetical protein DFR58_10846 [Anaerobacterium chartisolvens]|uniref:Cthe-2314-like HEPN domain-containing protein n=1 Tax=Anaerobacterium chartisolvens TaxID=1297424 RepID=A0A369B6K2_9FIRM|nr:Cthe_2314 family HEPN domain-containing protein [Anaerobacterium chartisolvens]RCX17152.1 hypothetical protein DFR58_10846 [Anaerobacterium chartisolvens]